MKGNLQPQLSRTRPCQASHTPHSPVGSRLLSHHSHALAREAFSNLFGLTLAPCLVAFSLLEPPRVRSVVTVARGCCDGHQSLIVFGLWWLHQNSGGEMWSCRWWCPPQAAHSSPPPHPASLKGSHSSKTSWLSCHSLYTMPGCCFPSPLLAVLMFSRVSSTSCEKPLLWLLWAIPPVSPQDTLDGSPPHSSAHHIIL